MKIPKKLSEMFVGNVRNFLIILVLMFIVLCYFLFIHGSHPTEIPMKSENEIQIKVLSFNLWYSGDKVENGIQKIVKHIKAINPDIAALQVHP